MVKLVPINPITMVHDTYNVAPPSDVNVGLDSPQ